MAEVKSITRRNFLVAGVAVGTIGFLGSENASAAPDSLNRLAKDKGLGSLEYIQLHCTDDFSLSQALSVVETLTPGYTLEKVGAVGESKFVGAPKNVLATLYYKEGLRATVSSGKSFLPSIGTVRAEDGDVQINDKRLEIFSPEGTLQESLIFDSHQVEATHKTLELVIRSFEEAKTLFVEETP